MRSVLLTMSLAGTLTLFCCVLFFRLFGKSLKAKWKRVLLILALAFYLFPLPQYKFLLLRVVTALHLIPEKGAISSDTILQINNSFAVFIDAAGRSFYSEAQAIKNIIICLLFVVSAVILLYHFANDILVKKAAKVRSQPAGAEEASLLEELKICMGVRRRIQLVQSEQVSVPVVSGIFSPTILLPRGERADDRALRGMLLHELSHIKHWDILFQWLCLLAVALHWYNPLIYLLFHLLTEANEQYSDAKAVEKLSEQEKRRYCEDLINYSELAGMRDSSLVVLGFSKSAKKQIRGRIDEVLNKKRKRPGIALSAGVLVLLMGTAAAFVYRPPFTMTGSMPGSIDHEILFDQDVDVYFKYWDPQTDNKTPISDLFQLEQED